MSRSVSAPSSVTKTSPCWNGLMVPGSTLMYGSSFRRVTLRPRDSRIAAREAAAIPLPREDTTPPVTNTNLVITDGAERHVREMEIIPQTLLVPAVAGRVIDSAKAGMLQARNSGVQQRLHHLVHCPGGGGRMFHREKMASWYLAEMPSNQAPGS